jgi:hypothetical protein
MKKTTTLILLAGLNAKVCIKTGVKEMNMKGILLIIVLSAILLSCATTGSGTGISLKEGSAKVTVTVCVTRNAKRNGR